ncbi:Protein of unknown function DUF1350 [Cinnamomum micranthum f. kanehirae]|uniref:DUF1350 domain-containing protein n=1 Tax=Cinnamomum micranthum f. kanehirae TaxID=337451 RepID=A0A443N3V6_9MAGN|nr:Protein of unknown function DUF1350 [Cinnamomum micranthum f. kanehirae]
MSSSVFAPSPPFRCRNSSHLFFPTSNSTSFAHHLLLRPSRSRPRIICSNNNNDDIIDITTNTNNNNNRRSSPEPVAIQLYNDIERLITETARISNDGWGVTGDWSEVEGAWVLKPRNSKPTSVVHFIGGIFVGAAPQLTYRLFLERLSDKGSLVIATPYASGFDHFFIADEVQCKFDRCLRFLPDNVNNLPTFGVGHSLGSVIHLLIGSRYAVQRSGNVLMAFNNKRRRLGRRWRAGDFGCGVQADVWAGQWLRRREGLVEGGEYCFRGSCDDVVHQDELQWMLTADGDAGEMETSDTAADDRPTDVNGMEGFDSVCCGFRSVGFAMTEIGLEWEEWLRQWEASQAVPLFSPVIVPMAQSFGPLLSQLTSSPTIRLGTKIAVKEREDVQLGVCPKPALPLQEFLSPLLSHLQQHLLRPPPPASPLSLPPKDHLLEQQQRRHHRHHHQHQQQQQQEIFSRTRCNSALQRHRKKLQGYLMMGGVLLGAWVLKPRNSKPTSVVHFIGGIFVGAAPQLTYRLFLERLSDKGSLVIATPYASGFDHFFIADEVQCKFDRCLRFLPDNVNNLPTFGVGHSLGSVIHLLIGSRYAVQRSGNVLMAFNNKEASQAVPLFSPVIVPMAQSFGPLLSQLTSSPTIRLGAEMAMKQLENLSPPIMKQVLPLIEQLPPLYMDLVQGREDFIPKPEETRRLIKSYYGIPRNLLVKFKDDLIDETPTLAQVLSTDSAISSILDLSIRMLPGDHGLPLQQIRITIYTLKFNEVKDMIFGFDENFRDSHRCMEVGEEGVKEIEKRQRGNLRAIR